MIAKSLFAAAALVMGLAATLPASEARADVDVDIGIGINGGYNGWYGGYHGWYGGYYPRPVRPYHYRPAPHRPVNRYVTCNEGRQILYNRGYRNVNARDCHAPRYSFTAWRNGHQYLVRVTSQGAVNQVAVIR